MMDKRTRQRLKAHRARKRNVAAKREAASLRPLPPLVIRDLYFRAEGVPMRDRGLIFTPLGTRPRTAVSGLL